VSKGALRCASRLGKIAGAPLPTPDLAHPTGAYQTTPDWPIL